MYLQHSEDKQEFQYFLSPIMDAGLSRIGPEFVCDLEKKSVNPAITRPRKNPEMGIQMSISHNYWRR